MHYDRQFHFGDVSLETARLTQEQLGAWLRLRCYVLEKERALPREMAEIFEITHADKKSEQVSTEFVVKKFFKISDDGWVNERLSEKIAAFHGLGKTRGVSGTKGGKAKANAGNAKQNLALASGDVASAKQTEATLVNEEPQTTNQEPEASGAAGAAPGAAREMPPAVEFPSGFPSTADLAVAWARGGGYPIAQSDDWIRSKWAEKVAEGFKAGNGNQIVSWAHWIHGRSLKPDAIRASEAGNFGQKKERGGGERAAVKLRVERDETLPEPPFEWRKLLQECYPPEQYPEADYTLAWGLYTRDQRREIISLAKVRGLLPAEWKQAPGTLTV